MKRRRALYWSLCVVFLIAVGLVIPLRKPNGLESQEGFEAEVGAQVLATARAACLDGPLARLAVLKLRVNSVWLKDIFMTRKRSLEEAGQPLAASRRGERYHYQAGIQGYTWFGIPVASYTLSGDRDGESVDCSSA